MIARTRFRSVYDIDLLGAAVLILLGLASWWIVVAPWQQTWRDYRTLADLRVAARLGIREDSAEIQRSRKELARLEQVVASQVDSTPDADALSNLLRDMTDLAERTDIELLSVVPQPIAEEGIHRVADIKFTGRGRSTQFIKFLDRLAEGNPHQSLMSCSITRQADCMGPPEEEADERGEDARAGTCSLMWTVRFYLLPRESGSWLQPEASSEAGQGEVAASGRAGRRGQP